MALAAVLGPSILLIIATVNGQSTDQFAAIADLDYCGQSCPSSCDEEEWKYAVCRCDSECERYGDCCSPQSERLNCTGGEQGTQPLAGLQCRSIHLDSRTLSYRMEAFWMVSACPEDWPANQDDEVLREVGEKCSNGSDTLPPVTNLDSGVVYKNEYCAVCHQVANIQPWGYRFGCSPCLENKLANQNVNLTREVIENECIACGFHVPPTGPPPRHCLHDSLVIDECLTREVLEELTGLRWEEEVYSNIETICQTGPLRIVRNDTCDVPPFYRNQYCAICNCVRPTSLYCGNPYINQIDRSDYCLVEAESCDSGSGVQDTPGGSRMKKADSGNDTTPTRPPGSCGFPLRGYASFSLFFDVMGDSGVITSEIISTNITTSCSMSQVFDPINRVCRQTICPEGFATLRGSCAIDQRQANSTDDSLITCDEGLIVLHESEFELLDNDTLLFGNGTFEIVGRNGRSPIICSNFTQNGTFSQTMTVFYYSYPLAFSVLTYVCCSLSVVGCVLVLLTYSLFRELRTLPGQILMNLASTILATCLFLLVGIRIAVVVENDGLCEATAILLHFLVLSQFTWTSIMSFELLSTLYRAHHLHPVEDKSTKNKMFLLYFIIGWGIPILITSISLVVNFTTDLIQYGTDGFCWIGHVPSFYVAFLVPVTLFIVLNGITFIITLGLLFKASRTQAKLKTQQKISYLRIYLCAFSITGLTWVFGFLAISVRDDWAWYTFIILTSTQGLVIAIAFILTKKIGSLYKKVIFSSLSAVTAFKRSSKQPTQARSLPKYLGNVDNAKVKTTKSATVLYDIIPNDAATQSTREKESGDQIPISMDI